MVEQGPELPPPGTGPSRHARAVAHRASGVGDRRVGRRDRTVRAADPIRRRRARLPGWGRVRLAIAHGSVGGPGARAVTAHEHAEPVPGTVTQEEPGSRPIEPDAEHETVLDVGRPPRPALRAAAAFLIYLVIGTVLWGIPVLAHFSTRYISNGRGDVDLYRWFLAWVPWAVSHGHSPLFTDKVFAPGGVDLTWSTTMPGPAIVIWPVTRLFGTLASHNLLKLLAPALAGWGAFLVS